VGFFTVYWRGLATAPQPVENMTTKEKVLSVINSLGEDATLDDVIDRLYLLRKIELGIAQADAGDLIDHDTLMSELEREDVP
jgi:hypothetical protein